MYSIKERKTKDGKISYQIQVKITDYNGNIIQKAKTWKPEQNYTDKQLGIALKRIAKNFENEVVEKYGGRSVKPIATEETKFNDFALYWLKCIESNKAASYYASAKIVYGKIKDIMEPYRLKDLTPVVLENIYKKIHLLKQTKTYIVSKDNLHQLLKEKYGYKYLKEFSNDCGLDRSVIRDALHQRTSLNTATVISNTLNIPMDEIFYCEIEEVDYKASYYESMKKTVRLPLQYAVRLGIIKRNYARKLYLTTKLVDQTKVPSLTNDETKRLVQECNKINDIRKKTAILFLLLTGVRKGELCGLNWSDIDLINKTVKIERQYESVAYKGLLLKEPKTKNSIRVIELPDCLIAILSDYKVWYNDKKENLKDKWENSDDSLFVGRYGKRLHPTTIRNWFDDILKKANIKHYAVHSLRHTNITLLLESGIPVVTVSRRVGHSKCRTTLDVYADYFDSSDKDASSVINNYFAK